jgi:hypothetical protein
MIDINVKNFFSGADAFSVRLPGGVPLQVLKTAIGDKSTSPSTDLGTSWSLVHGDRCLMDEFNLGESRWKSLIEYGIEDGTTLGFVQHGSPSDRLLNIVIRLASEDHGFPDDVILPFSIASETSLSELERQIFQKVNLSSEKWVLHMSFNGSPLPAIVNVAEPLRTSLAEHYIEGSTWGLKIEPKRTPFEDIANSSVHEPIELWRQCRSQVALKPTTAHPRLQLGNTQQDITECQISAPSTPCNSIVCDVEYTPAAANTLIDGYATPCKQNRPRGRANKMIKRL